MSGEVLSEMIRQYLALGLAQSSFSWQGGEPTLAGLEFFREAVRLMQKHGRGGQAVGNALQTNALLLDEEWAEFLARYRFLVGASIDGPRDLHEHYRGTSFDRALRGAKVCMERGVEVNVLAVVSRASEGRATEVYRFFREQGFRHMQFIPCAEPGEQPGEAAPFSVRPEAWGDFLIELFEAWRADGEGACLRLFDSLTELAGTGVSPYCIFSPACAQYLVVEATGDIYPCDFFVREERRVGNLLSFALDRAWEAPSVREFGRLKAVRPDKCRSCRHWRVCYGGCLKDRLVAGGLDRPSCLCEGIRRFLDHAWRYFRERAERFYAPARRSASATAARAATEGRIVVPRGRGPSPHRNSPCPCGSGRKFKHCCGRNAAT
jgi:uncharacterized protein